MYTMYESLCDSMYHSAPEEGHSATELTLTSAQLVRRVSPQFGDGWLHPVSSCPCMCKVGFELVWPFRYDKVLCTGQSVLVCKHSPGMPA